MKNLKKIRIAAGVSQHELALESGVPRSTIQLIEAGLRAPTIEVRDALASALGVRPETLIGAVEGVDRE